LLLAFGLVLGLVGIVDILRGIQVSRHWTGQPQFSSGLIAAGGVCVLLAGVPSSWIAKVATSRRGKAQGHESAGQ